LHHRGTTFGRRQVGDDLRVAHVDTDDARTFLLEPRARRRADAAGRTGDADGAHQLTCRPALPQYWARSAFLSGLPSGLTGLESATSIDCGAGCAPLCSFTSAASSWGAASARGRSTTIALTASPHFSSGTPITAHCETDGCSASTSSISRGNTLKPPLTIMSF